MSSHQGIFMTGTDTDVGKTQVAYGLASAMRRCTELPSIRLWKPIQTGVSLGTSTADSYRLWHGSGTSEQEEDGIASYTFPDPLAPWLAATRCGIDISYEYLLQEGHQRFQEDSFWIVEGAGGLGVPITNQQLMVDLVRDLELPLVIVARWGLGTVNHTLQTITYARQQGIDVLGVILNGYPADQKQTVQENAMMIERFGQTSIVGMLPWMPEEQHEAWYAGWTAVIEQHINIHELYGWER